MRAFYLCLLGLLLLTACTHKNDSVVYDFFDYMQKNIGNPFIQNKIKNAPEDSLYKYRIIFQMEYDFILKEGNFEEEIERFLEEAQVEKDANVRSFIMLFAFQEYLHGKELSFRELEFRGKEALRKVDSLYLHEEKIEINRILEAVMYNDQKWAIGDTLNLFFQAQKSEDKSYIFFTRFRSPLLTLERYGLAFVQGVLVSKKYNVETSDSDMPKERFGIEFNIRITKLGSSSTYLFGKKLEKNGQMSVPLWVYGMKIE